MSGDLETVRYLVQGYGSSLRRQIEDRGSNLACSDKDFSAQVMALLHEDPRETHCLGLDPLKTMEESLQDRVNSVRRETRGGLGSLEKAFQVLEQAAVNLYTAPWREEYKVVKMYSGVFTHLVKPALSLARIHSLFGLLGYESSPTRPEQLQLQTVASPEDLLRFSCAFFLARCECRLLLETLGKRGEDAAWQLGVVRQRLRGHTLQASLDTIRTTLAEQQMKTFGGDSDVDLYTDQADDEEPKHLAVPEERGPPPSHMSWETIGTSSLQGSQHPPSCTSPPSLSPQHCVSTLNYQLTSLPSETTTGGFSPESRKAGGPAALDPEGLSPDGVREPPDRQCACLKTSVYVKECMHCNQLHDSYCESLQRCSSRTHSVLYLGNPTKSNVQDSGRSASPCGGSAPSFLTLDDSSAKTTSDPIHFHDCCDYGTQEPDYMCVSCHVFHMGSCVGLRICQENHEVRVLRVCRCKERCQRKPMVLCKYCGTEYCSDCWYKNPVVCVCGQTFDRSTSV